VLILIFFIVAQVEAQQGQRGCDCPALEEFLKNIASKDIANLLIAEKKEAIRRALINASGCSSNPARPKLDDLIFYFSENERADFFMKLFKEEDLPEDFAVAQRLARNTPSGLSDLAMKDIVITAKFKKARDCRENKICNRPVSIYLQQVIENEYPAENR
jgi:hypothetical protein